MPAPDEIVLHATAVTLGLRGLLILGPSGAGKSSLALSLMALGCDLVSDDQTVMTSAGGHLFAAPPTGLAGRIEARGVGILSAPFARSAQITLAVDLGQRETERLPQFREFECLGARVPLVLGQDSTHFSAAVLACLRGGRAA